MADSDSADQINSGFGFNGPKIIWGKFLDKKDVFAVKRVLYVPYKYSCNPNQCHIWIQLD